MGLSQMSQAMGLGQGDTKIGKGCKHYLSLSDQKSADFKEFCWMDKESRVQRDTVCKRFESKNPELPEGVLTFYIGLHK
jgi:hypothetical protein